MSSRHKNYFIQKAVKPANEGRFKAYCERGGNHSVNKACINRGLDSPSPRVRHEAQFAKTMKHIAAQRR